MVRISNNLLDKFGAKWRLAIFDVLYFAREFCNFEPSSEQEQLLLHIQYATLFDNDGAKRVLARSGQGVGKTAALCIAVLWRHLRAEGTITVITAPTAAQCREVFFAELQRRVQAGHPILQGLMEITATRAHVKHKKWGNNWAIISRTATNADCLRGLHHPHMTVVVEEMSGVADDILNTMIGTCSQEDNLIMGIGNPSRREGYFFRAFMDPIVSQNWKRNVRLSRKKLSEERPELCSPHAIAALLLEWGPDSDAYLVNVLGEFPKIGGDTVLPMEWVRKAMESDMLEAVKVDPSVRVLALDFARFGGDENVIFRRHGNALTEMYARNMLSPVQAVRRAKMMAVDHNWRPKEFTFVADATGMGQGMVDLLREPIDGMDEGGFEVREWHNHAKPGGRFGKTYHNLITRAWFELRKRLYEFCEKDGPPVYLPNDRHLFEQLISMRYEFDNKNRYKTFDKDKFKKESGLSSPDRAEAAVMALCSRNLQEAEVIFQGEAA